MGHTGHPPIAVTHPNSAGWWLERSPALFGSSWSSDWVYLMGNSGSSRLVNSLTWIKAIQGDGFPINKNIIPVRTYNLTTVFGFKQHLIVSMFNLFIHKISDIWNGRRVIMQYDVNADQGRKRMCVFKCVYIYIYIHISYHIISYHIISCKIFLPFNFKESRYSHMTERRNSVTEKGSQSSMHGLPYFHSQFHNEYHD